MRLPDNNKLRSVIAVILLCLGFYKLGNITKSVPAIDLSQTTIDKQNLTLDASKESLISSEEAKKVIDEFEKFQMDRNASKVLDMFTPPGNEEQKKDFSFLKGLDLSGPRMYTTAGTGYKVDTYKIIKTEKLQDPMTLVVYVNEERSFWDNTAGKFGSAKAGDYLLELHLLGTNILIENYYSDNYSKEVSKKYSGFY